MGFTPDRRGGHTLGDFCKCVSQSLFGKIGLLDCFPLVHHFEHWDVESAFTNAPIEETIYVHQVSGFGWRLIRNNR